MKKSQFRIFILPIAMLGVTFVAGILASAPRSSAEESISPVDDEINITVDSACTMGIMSSSSMTGIVPGETKNIGAYRMAAYCNDSNGYDIYAIGYTNGEYGNTNMISTDGNIIPTGTSGEDSYWNMQLIPGTASGQTTHIPTIVSPFTNYTTIPSDYTKVVTYPSTTIPQGEDPMVSGSYFGASYDAHASTTLPSGTYTGQVQYVMVHPVGAEAPEKPNIGQLTYMQDFATLSEQEKSNILKYTEVGKQYTLIDSRDNKAYYVAKLADGNVWMTQNLDLDIDTNKTYTPADTDVSTNWTPVRGTTNGTTWINSLTDNGPHSYDPGELYVEGIFLFNNRETCEAHGGRWESGKYDSYCIGAKPTSSVGDKHYHLGNYYNYAATVAMNDISDYAYNNAEFNQSICPAGWRLPTYSGDKSYQDLASAQSLIAGVNGNSHDLPVYFVYGSLWSGSFHHLGSEGRYWSNLVWKVNSDIGSHQFQLLSSGVISDGSGGTGWYHGASVRCVVR